MTRMRSKSEIVSRLIDPGIIAVVRAQKAEQVLPLSEALIGGGIIAIEITMTTPNAIETIREPLPHLRIIPTGIATVDDVAGFITAGCVGVGLGSLLITRPILEEANWLELTRRARDFVVVVRRAREK